MPSWDIRVTVPYLDKNCSGSEEQKKEETTTKKKVELVHIYTDSISSCMDS
jgi:hypothetical protein